MEKCETPCSESCLISQDPQTPQIVAHICSPDSVLCNHHHDDSCARHVVVSMEHRIRFSLPSPKLTDGPGSSIEGSTTLFTKYSLPSGLIKDLKATTSVAWTGTTATASSTTHVRFADTDITEEYVTPTQGEKVCNATSFGCPSREDFCFGIVMDLGEISYGCYPDKPVCSSIDGCVRVCLPHLESCLKTVSPSLSWGSSTVTPNPTVSGVLPDLTDNTGATEEYLTPTRDDVEASDELNKGAYTISNESDESELDNETDWEDVGNEVENLEDNEAEKKPNSSSFSTSYSVIMSLVVVLGVSMV